MAANKKTNRHKIHTDKYLSQRYPGRKARLYTHHILIPAMYVL
jgi:hypothetical protein